MNIFYAELMNSKHFVVSNFCICMDVWVASFTLSESVNRFSVIETEKSHQRNFNSVFICTFILYFDRCHINSSIKINAGVFSS